ncbi:MAG: DUF1573 domain-containing protein [Bacteroides sp.]|nr:DUF1573 domain-containing protein [Bacteroides sp.]
MNIYTIKSLFLLGGIFILLTLTEGCTSSEKRKIIRIVRQWEGKEVLFPEDPVFTLYGKDTVDFALPSSGYRIFSYVDSIGCISCKLQLEKWKYFIRETDSVMGFEVPVLFFFHPKNYKDLSYILRRDRFGLPVCIDEKNEINHLNQFPQEMAFQTFLLNEENRVVAIGNPVHNPRVKELYYHTMLEKEPVKTPVLYTQVEADRYSADLGSFDWTLPAEANFTIRNRGNRLWVIEDIVTSCGCISVAYDKEPLPPGGDAL